MSTDVVRYEAVWVPGLHEIDRDEGLAIGFRWLEEAETTHGKSGVVVMPTKKMSGNAPLLEQASRRWPFISTRSHSPHAGPLLAIWPNARTLEYAEQLALGSALCVIPATFDISPWVRRTGARCLVPGFSVEQVPAVPQEVAKALDDILSFGGHNSFLGAGEKERTIRGLRDIFARPNAPNREAIEDYLATSGKTDTDGVSRAGRWYDEIREGKRHRDYRGRTIRG